MTGVTLIFYTLVVLAVCEGHVAVFGFKKDRFGRGDGDRELLNNGLIIAGRWGWGRG